MAAKTEVGPAYLLELTEEQFKTVNEKYHSEKKCICGATIAAGEASAVYAQPGSDMMLYPERVKKLAVRFLCVVCHEEVSSAIQMCFMRGRTHGRL